MTDAELIAAARMHPADRPIHPENLFDGLADRLEAALAREDEVILTTIHQQNAGAALVRAYQAKVKEQTIIISAARHIVQGIMKDQPTGLPAVAWAALNEFLDATKEYES